MSVTPSTRDFCDCVVPCRHALSIVVPCFSPSTNHQAKRRNLPILKTTADALPHATSAKNVHLFSSLGVLSKEELESRQAVFAGEYITKISNEAQATLGLFNNFSAPAGYDTQTRIGSAIIAATSAGAKVDGHQHASLAAIGASLTKGVEAAANLKVRDTRLCCARNPHTVTHTHTHTHTLRLGRPFPLRAGMPSESACLVRRLSCGAPRCNWSDFFVVWLPRGVCGRQAKLDQLHGDEGSVLHKAALAQSTILPGLREVRSASDEIELKASKASWNLPTYHEMLFHQC